MSSPPVLINYVPKPQPTNAPPATQPYFRGELQRISDAIGAANANITDLNGASAGLVNNSTTISGGAANQLLYDNGGTIEEASVGSGLSLSGGVLAATGGSGLTYLATLTGSSISDTTHFSGSYRSFMLVFRNLLLSGIGGGSLLQVHSGGSFQTTSYLSSAIYNSAGGAPTGLAQTTGIPISVVGALNSPGMSGYVVVSNLSGTSAPKFWVGASSYYDGVNCNLVTFSGFWNSSGAIDGFQIPGTFSSGSVDIYGIT